MGLWEKIEISKKHSVRRKKMNRPKADSSAEQRPSPSETMAGKAGNTRPWACQHLLPAAPQPTALCSSQKEDRLFLSLTHRGHLIPQRHLQKCLSHHTPASTACSHFLVFAKMRRGMGSPVDQVGKGLITCAINFLSAQKTNGMCLLLQSVLFFGTFFLWS